MCSGGRAMGLMIVWVVLLLLIMSCLLITVLVKLYKSTADNVAYWIDSVECIHWSVEGFDNPEIIDELKWQSITQKRMAKLNANVSGDDLLRFTAVFVSEGKSFKCSAVYQPYTVNDLPKDKSWFPYIASAIIESHEFKSVSIVSHLIQSKTKKKE